LGSLFKKFGIYLLAIALPVILILVYEGFVWSQNQESLQQQERRANEQQAKEQPSEIRREQQLAAERNARLERARRNEAQRELQRLQQVLGENEQSSQLRCVVAQSSDKCRCFDQQNNLVEVQDQRCRSLAGE